MNSENALRIKKRLTRVYIYVMFMIFPLFTGFWGYASITRSKLTFYLGATCLWLLLLLLTTIRSRSFARPRFTSIEKCILIYFAICCVSALISPYGLAVILGGGRFDGLVSTALTVLIFFAVSRYAKPERGYIYALAISMTICCIVALFQLFGYNPLKLFPNSYTYYHKGIFYSGEFLGTIGNGNLFSAFLAMCLAVVSGFFIAGKRNRLFLLPAIALGAFCLFKCTVSAGKLALLISVFAVAPFLVTDISRLRRLMQILSVFCLGGFISLCFFFQDSLGFAITKTSVYVLIDGVALLLVSFALKCLRETSRRKLQLSVAATSAAIASAGILFVYFYGGSQGTVYELSNTLRGNIQENYGSSRILIWKKCLELILERPILGGGPGTSALRLDISFSRFVPETGATLSSFVDNAHNVYLGILTDTGVLSLMTYLLAMALTLINTVKSANKKPFVMIPIFGIICYWIQDFFGLGLFMVSPIMWIIWGLAAQRETRVKS